MASLSEQLTASVMDASSDEVTERTGLARDSSLDRDEDRQSISAEAGDDGETSLIVRERNKLLWIIFAVTLVTSAAVGFFILPITNTFEAILCRRFYKLPPTAAQPLDSDSCKLDAIQADLAYLFAVGGSLDAVVGATSAIPWGFMSDRIGRRPVFCLVAVGYLIQMSWSTTIAWFEITNLKLLWLSSLAVMIGGGGQVSGAILYSIVTDIMPESERGIGFMRIHVASMAGNLLAPTIVSAMMPLLGPWYSILIGAALMLSSGIAVWLLPETMPSRSKANESSGFSFKGSLMGAFRALKRALSLFKSADMLLLMGSCLVNHPIISSTLQFLNIFVPKRYHVHITETGYIQTAFGISQAFILLKFMPSLSRIFMKPSAARSFRIKGEKHRDLVLARASYFVSAVGAFIMAASPALGGFVVGILVLSFGSAQSSLVKGVLAVYVDAEHRSQLFTVLSVVDTVSQFYAHPMLAGLFAEGMRLGDGWIGLPYYGISALCVIPCILLVFVHLPKTRYDEDCSD